MLPMEASRGARGNFPAAKQEHGWTYGILANHQWSFAGDDQRVAVSATFLQPFLSFTFPTYTSLGINTESTYDWKSQQWSVPVNFFITQILKVRGQPLSLQAGLRYWADSPEGAGPKGFGARFALTFLFPK
jgi:hypothetical protein